MNKNLEAKKQNIEEVYSKITQANEGNKSVGLSTAIFDYSTLSSNEVNELRSKLFEANASLKILKNTLIKILFSKFNVNLDKSLEGQNALVVTDSNFTNGLKIINDFIKATQKGTFKLGVLNGKVITAQEVVKLSKLPSREVLLSQLLSTFNSPARSFVVALNETNAKFVRVLNSIKESKS